MANSDETGALSELRTLQCDKASNSTTKKLD